MMNHFFALLIILGFAFGVYTSTSDAAKITTASVRTRKWEAVLKKASEAQAKPTAGASAPVIAPDKLSVTWSDGKTERHDDIAVTDSEVFAARWERIKTTGNALTMAAVDPPKTAVKICLEFIGVMALWLGVMKVAERAGLVAMLGRALAPLMRFVFPDVPSNHPAMSGMILNISANMLGLDNAATPLGLAAMKDLQKLNKNPRTATNAQIMFLAINTSSVTVIPFSVVALRAVNGSTNPQSIIIPAILATICSTVTAIVVTKTLSIMNPDPPVGYDEQLDGPNAEATAVTAAAPHTVSAPAPTTSTEKKS